MVGALKTQAMNKKDLSVGTLQRYSKNPFLKEMGIVFQVKDVLNSGYFYMENGEKGYNSRTSQKVIDTYKFTKIFLNKFHNYEEAIYGFDTKTWKCFFYLLTNIKKNEDLMEIDPYVLMRTTGIKRREDVEKAFANLVEARVVAVYSDAVNHFWINTALFFSGSRDRLVKNEDGTINNRVLEYKKD